MKVKHNIPAAFVSTDSPIHSDGDSHSERYEQEIQSSLRHAKRSHRDAVRRMHKAEKSSLSGAVVAQARALVAQRLEELNAIRALMRGPYAAGVKHSGRGSVRRATNHEGSL